MFFLLGLVVVINDAHAQVTKKVDGKNALFKSKAAVVKPIVIIDTVVIVQNVRVKITTSLGDIVIKLYDKTPKHRDNFIKLVNEHIYDSLLFHRVIKNFMIQGGDPKSKNAAPGIRLGEGDVGYTIPAEFDSTLFHKRGALAAARDDNPKKASSGCQFYIVEGKKLNDSELDIIENKNGVHFSSPQRMTYKINGGTPNLDSRYTVFGEVESGMEVVDKIELEPVDYNNRPLNNITMKMEIIKEE